MRFNWIIALILFLASCSSGTEIVQVTDLIDSVRQVYAPDKRVAIVEIEASETNGTILLSGETNKEEALKSLRASLKDRGIAFQSNVTILPDQQGLDGKFYGLINNSVGNLRSNPRHSAELATQATLGTPVKVLKNDGEWYRIQTPDDYIAWIDHGGIQLMDESEYQDWKNAEKIIYTNVSGFSYSLPNEEEIVSDVVVNSVFELLESAANHYKVAYPDGRISYLRKSECSTLPSWIGSLSYDQIALKETALQLFGAPYLWGGTSSKGMDCSGFTKTVYLKNGFIIPRDASQQVHAGRLVDEDKRWENLEIGDLLFFGTPKTDSTRERVVHVGMWIDNNRFIHASKRVRISSVDPNEAYYDGFNVNRYLRTKRYLDQPSGNIIALKEQNIF